MFKLFCVSSPVKLLRTTPPSSVSNGTETNCHLLFKTRCLATDSDWGIRSRQRSRRWAGLRTVLKKKTHLVRIKRINNAHMKASLGSGKRRLYKWTSVRTCVNINLLSLQQARQHRGIKRARTPWELASVKELNKIYTQHLRQPEPCPWTSLTSELEKQNGANFRPQTCLWNEKSSKFHQTISVNEGTLSLKKKKKRVWCDWVGGKEK